MRTALITLALALSAACASTAPRQAPLFNAIPASSVTTANETYEQYVDENGRVVTIKSAKAQPQPAEASRARLFNNWTSAYLFSR